MGGIVPCCRCPGCGTVTALREHAGLGQGRVQGFDGAHHRDRTFPWRWAAQQYWPHGLPRSETPRPAIQDRRPTHRAKPGPAIALEPAQPSPRSVGQLPRPEHLLAAGPDLTALLEDGAALLDSARLSATAEARLLGFVEAADFAGRVEEISRSVEYLQVVAAQAVERARKEAQQAGPGSSAAAPGWRTGWTDPPTGTDMALVSNVDGDRSTDAAQLLGGTAVPVDGDRSTTGTGTGSAEWGAGSTASVLDDGYRNAARVPSGTVADQHR